MQIIIPMSGTGERFKKAGYKLPKPLIQVGNKCIIEHVVDLFPGECNFIFIVNQDHLNDSSLELESILKKIAPKGQIVPILPHKLGPVHAVQAASSYINDDEPTIVNYCDFTCYWNYNNFKEFVSNTKCDGAVPAYKGFHPHMIGPNNYAFIKENNQWLIDIQEKAPFTDNRSEEFASSGTYYFKNGKLLKDYCKITKELDLNVNGEFYISMLFRPMANNGLKIAVYGLQHFMQWGTPADLEEYNYWSKGFEVLLSGRDNTLFEGLMLMPMAGLGSRFAKEGYELPKPLIPVSGVSMVVQATQDLPVMSEYRFVVRRDLPGLETIKSELKGNFPSCQIVELPEVTDGQARTCLLGLDGVADDKSLMIGACDNGIVYNHQAFRKLWLDASVDVIVWGIRGYPGAVQRPHMYGWIAEEEGRINSISVKKPLSSSTTDPIVIGAFSFKRAGDFIDAANSLINRSGTVNNEYYVDTCINDAINLGLNVQLFEVDSYLCWGTPDDHRAFEYWQSCFSKWSEHPYTVEEDSRVPVNERKVLLQKFYDFKPFPS